jgi:hypothetical protein
MVYTPERVCNLNFGKEELCNDCEPINAEELEKEGLIDVIKSYETSYEYGLEEGIGNILPAKADEFFWHVENQPVELIKSASKKGYEMGFKEGKRREESKRRRQEAAQRLQKDLQERERTRQLQQREGATRQLPASQRQERRCSICGMTGHNAQTCPEARRCSICNGYDHDARNCPNARRCSICGSHTHDARTCSRRES